MSHKSVMLGCCLSDDEMQIFMKEYPEYLDKMRERLNRRMVHGDGRGGNVSNDIRRHLYLLISFITYSLLKYKRSWKEIFEMIIVCLWLVVFKMHYHMQDVGNLGFNQWTFTHKWSAVLFALIVIAHILLHLKWYEVVFKKHLFRKNRVTTILTIIMIIVSLLGFLPWILTLFPDQVDLRHTLIEIHDKIGIVFTVIMIGHIIKRWKWYINLR